MDNKTIAKWFAKGVLTLALPQFMLPTYAMNIGNYLGSKIKYKVVKTRVKYSRNKSKNIDSVKVNDLENVYLSKNKYEKLGLKGTSNFADVISNNGIQTMKIIKRNSCENLCPVMNTMHDYIIDNKKIEMSKEEIKNSLPKISSENLDTILNKNVELGIIKENEGNYSFNEEKLKDENVQALTRKYVVENNKLVWLGPTSKNYSKFDDDNLLIRPIKKYNFVKTSNSNFDEKGNEKRINDISKIVGDKVLIKEGKSYKLVLKKDIKNSDKFYPYKNGWLLLDKNKKQYAKATA